MKDAATPDLGAVSQPHALFVAAVLYYAALLEPTPDSLSVLLLIWPALLAVPVLHGPMRIPLLLWYLGPLVGLIAIGLIATIVTVFDSIQLLRDLASLAFWLAIPPCVLACCTPRTASYEQTITALERLRIVASIAGALLSIRYVLESGVSPAMILTQNVRVDMRYLSSEPLATYAFVYFAFLASRAESTSRMLMMLVAAVISSVGLVAVTYRGPLLIGGAVLALGMLSSALANAHRRPLTIAATIAAGFTAVVLGFDAMTKVFEKLTRKFETVGIGNKTSEFLSIFGNDQSAFNTIFGNGFGTRTFVSGAATEASYTHNVFSYVYLKTGLLGCTLLSVLGVVLAVRLIQYRLIGSLIPELLTLAYIALFQGAFKHFGFAVLIGICVTRIVIEARRREVSSAVAPPAAGLV